MKKVSSIISIAAALLLGSSCNEWLDVHPRSQIEASVLFQNEDGYKTALTGVYILMAEADLYGKNTTMYLPETFARNWTIPTADVNLQMNRLAAFDFTHAETEPVIATVWLSYYNAIAQLNNILENLENTAVHFEYNNDALIKGEVLGLRAFLHFDLLRLFGPVPVDADLSAPAIPYVTTMTKETGALTSLSYADVVAKILNDLDAAEKLLATVDPIQHGTNSDDQWLKERQGRFNYFACLGTKARVYHWIGDRVHAVSYAGQVLDSSSFRLASESTFVSTSTHTANLIMYEEHLFGVHNPDLQKIVEPLFKAEGGAYILSQQEGYLDVCYEKAIHSSDIRYKPAHQPMRYWEAKMYDNSVLVNHFRKYTGQDQIGTSNRVPLLRLAEMYLILIENLPLSEAAAYFRTYRQSRGMDASVETTALLNEEARLNQLEKEYRKEFFGEGQMFFFYKRHRYAAYTWPRAFTLPADAYVLPKPKEQMAFE